MEDCKYCSDDNNIIATVFYYYKPVDSNIEIDIEPEDIKYCPLCGKRLEINKSRVK